MGARLISITEISVCAVCSTRLEGHTTQDCPVCATTLTILRATVSAAIAEEEATAPKNRDAWRAARALRDQAQGEVDRIQRARAIATLPEHLR